MNANSLKIYDALVDYFISTDQLGHYDSGAFSIALYGIKNDAKTLKEIKKGIEKLTKKYKLLVLDEKSEYTNVNILDIEL